MEPTRVIFKMEEGEPIAFFPDIPGNVAGTLVTCYRHIGQHGQACPLYGARLKPAKPHQFGALYRELTSLGYNLRIVRRFTRTR